MARRLQRILGSALNRARWPNSYGIVYVQDVDVFDTVDLFHNHLRHRNIEEAGYGLAVTTLIDGLSYGNIRPIAAAITATHEMVEAVEPYPGPSYDEAMSQAVSSMGYASSDPSAYATDALLFGTAQLQKANASLSLRDDLYMYFASACRILETDAIAVPFHVSSDVWEEGVAFREMKRLAGVGHLVPIVLSAFPLRSSMSITFSEFVFP